MPNYVYNTLRIRGTLAERERFKSAIFLPRPTFEAFEAKQRNNYMNKEAFQNREDKFEAYIAEQYETTTDTWQIIQTLYPVQQVLLNSVSPSRNLTPEETVSRMAQYGALDWYRWCIQNWGSKWGDFSGKLICHNDKITVLTFESAWSSPQAGMVEVSKQFPLLHFRVNWKEEDVHWGMYSFKNGEVKRYWEGRYR